jgi:GTPase-associated protein 1, N-terminal domain type 2/GTPase-associated protein 1, C-terminal domain/GTPase-associated protein 1, middle domain
VTRGFGNLYYTDCRPGQGLQGNAGFQFQATSRGIADEGMPLVQRAGLYEAPSAWMRDHRPVGEYPHSLAHMSDGGLFATAAGRYLGQEANGTREGNQFTHAVVTRDGADYGLARPAQLWAAGWWAGAPVEGTVLEPVPPHPATGPLDTETVRDRVRATPGGDELLVALLSEVCRLTDPDSRRKVVLVSADPEVAACWIAAATLLLPRPDALRTTFKIFVADAQYGQHDIIAVHPDWAGRSADTGQGTGLAVFDLDRGRHSEAEPAEHARFWVPRFLSEDPYDIVDAVELAGQWARSGGSAGPTPADRTAALVVAAGARLTSPEEVEAMASWLRTAPEEAMPVAREPVLQAVLDARPAAPVLRTLADAAGDRGWKVLPAIQRGLLTSEIAEVVATRDGVGALQGVLAHPPLLYFGSSADDAEERRDEVEAAIRDAGDPHVPALLQVADRHKVRPRAESFPAVKYRFATWWLNCQDDRLAPECWTASKQALPWARDILEKSFAVGGQSAVDAADVVRDGWWRPLWRDCAHPHLPLDRVVLGAAYARADADRAKVLRHVQRRIAADMPRGHEPSRLAWDVLFDRATPTVPEIDMFLGELESLGLPVAPAVAKLVSDVLDRDRISPTGLRIASSMRRQGLTLSSEQSRNVVLDTQLQTILAGLGTTAPAPGKAVMQAINAAPTELLRLRAAAVVDALIAAPHERSCAAIIGVEREKLRPLYTELETRWSVRQTPIPAAQAAAIAFTFTLSGSEPGSRDQELDFLQTRHRLGRFVAGLSKDDRDVVERAGGLGAPWWAWVAEIDPTRWSRLGKKLSRSDRHSSKEK